MNPTKEQWKKIFQTAKQIEERHDNIDKAFKAFQDIVAPDSYPLVLENHALQSFIDGLNIVFKDVTDDICYYLYEATMMKECTCEYKGKQYNAKDLDEYIQFLLDYRN